MFGSPKATTIQELEMTDKELFKFLEQKGMKKQKRKKDFFYKNQMYMVYYNSADYRIEISRMVSSPSGSTHRTFAAFYYNVGALRGADWSSVLEFRSWLLGEIFD